MSTESASRSSALTGSEPSGDAPHNAPAVRMRGSLTARAPTSSALVLSVCATVAGFGIVSSLAHWAIPPVLLPAPLPSQNQDAESLAFVATFAVLLPLTAALRSPVA